MSVRIYRNRHPLDSAAIELRASLQPQPKLTHCVFDFDGTLSWLRHGWPGMMCDVFQEQLEAGHYFAGAQGRELLLGEVLALNGKPTIFQCVRFVELCERRGGPRLEAEPLRVEFQRRLDAAIARRIAQVRSGASTVQSYHVHAVQPFLEYAAEAGLTLAILSSTVQERVEEEAELLGLRRYFGRHVYGGKGDPLRFTKRAVFERFLQEELCTGLSLLSFGDGPVELRDTKELGGIAIAVCSDEFQNGSGLVDPHKRAVLFEAGADAAIPDYREAPQLLDFLLGR